MQPLPTFLLLALLPSLSIHYHSSPSVSSFLVSRQHLCHLCQLRFQLYHLLHHPLSTAFSLPSLANFCIIFALLYLSAIFYPLQTFYMSAIYPLSNSTTISAFTYFLLSSVVSLSFVPPSLQSCLYRYNMFFISFSTISHQFQHLLKLFCQFLFIISCLASFSAIFIDFPIVLHLILYHFASVSSINFSITSREFYRPFCKVSASFSYYFALIFSLISLINFLYQFLLIFLLSHQLLYYPLHRSSSHLYHFLSNTLSIIFMSFVISPIFFNFATFYEAFSILLYI